MIGLRRGLLFYDFQNKLNVIEALKIIWKQSAHFQKVQAYYIVFSKLFASWHDTFTHKTFYVKCKTIKRDFYKLEPAEESMFNAHDRKTL